MSLRSRSQLLVACCLALAVIGFGCSGGDTAVPPTTQAVEEPQPGSGDATTPTTTSGVEPSDTEPPSTGPPDTEQEPVPEDVADTILAELDEIITATEDIRGLEFIREPQITLLTSAELAERVRAQIEEDLDPDDIAIEERVYAFLGLLDDGDRLDQILLDLYAEQVLGFYDGDTDELVVLADGDGLSPFAKFVASHELVHALTDQHFGFFDYWQGLVDAGRFDEANAALALAEGDATYTQLLWSQTLPPAEAFELATTALSQDTSALTAAPTYISDQLAFPYVEGQEFVAELIDGGGFAAVDAAYVAAPTTTEQVIHPERYLRGEQAIAVTLPETPLTGYEEYEEGPIGEARLRQLFLDSAGRGFAVQVGAGWGGDMQRVLDNGTDVAMVFIYQGDGESDTIELTEALIDHVRNAMDVGDGVADGSGLLFEGAAGYVFIDRDGDRLLFIGATENEAGATLRRTVGSP